MTWPGLKRDQLPSATDVDTGAFGEASIESGHPLNNRLGRLWPPTLHTHRAWQTAKALADTSLQHKATMKFRFVDKHDPAALRRRRLQAQRTQKCRQRQKTKQHIETLNYEAQTSHRVDSASENV
ncbi:Aldo-keto reductase yakc [Fusarium oxysporum f. sp. albedinis]|nr:Aldo-keto reductase yakc [Fusarium oxysporum f. sp. albedinis]